MHDDDSKSYSLNNGNVCKTECVCMCVMLCNSERREGGVTSAPILFYFVNKT